MAEQTAVPHPPPCAIELHGVGIRRSDRWLLHDISWSVPAASVCAVLGHNGSGKSTLARILSGYLFPTAGEVMVGGQRWGEVDLNEMRRSIRLIQSGGPYDADPSLTSRQVAETGASGTLGWFGDVAPADAARAEMLMRRVGLQAVLDRPWGTLSSGERIRTLVARALVRPPGLLLLDEPTAGLDLLAREQVLAALQSIAEAEKPPTMLLVTHHLEELLPSTAHVLLIRQGRMVSRGAPTEVLTRENLSLAYDCPVRVERHEGRFYSRVDPSAWQGLLA